MKIQNIEEVRHFLKPLAVDDHLSVKVTGHYINNIHQIEVAEHFRIGVVLPVAVEISKGSYMVIDLSTGVVTEVSGPDKEVA